MRIRKSRVIERRYLFSRGGLCAHGFFHALLIISGTATGAAVAAMLHVLIDQFDVGPILVLPFAVITAALFPATHLADVGKRIATARRMALVALNSATWLAIGISSSLFFLLVGYPNLDILLATVGIFSASFLVSMLLWYGYVGIGGEIIIVSSDCCIDCGYNLTGNISGVCPECGAVVMDTETESGKAASRVCDP